MTLSAIAPGLSQKSLTRCQSNLVNSFTERLKLIWLKASLSEMVRFLFIAKMYIYRFVPADSEIKF